MTRTARKDKKRFEEASSWSELKQSAIDGRVSKRKSKKPSKDRVAMTLKEGRDLVKVIETTRKKRAKKNKRSNVGDHVDERTMLRREKRRMRRAKMKECFGCREIGHRLEECPHKQKAQATGLCFKCGSTEHSVSRCETKLPPGTYPFATCFICGEKGHLTRSCPDNPKGLYPHGGGCSFCGSVEHLKANCPDKHLSKHRTQKGDTLLLASSTIGSADADTIVHYTPKKNRSIKKKPKTVKF